MESVESRSFHIVSSFRYNTSQCRSDNKYPRRLDGYFTAPLLIICAELRCPLSCMILDCLHGQYALQQIGVSVVRVRSYVFDG